MNDQVASHAPKKVSRRRVRIWARQSLVREIWEWVRSKEVTIPSVRQFAEAIAELPTSAVDNPDLENEMESPIFVLATGWRSGSTLLQRILVTDPELLLWGEPLGEITPIPEIAKMISRMSNYPELKNLCARDHLSSSVMVTSWIGALYPPVDDFRLGLRKLFDRWLGGPARQRGFQRWGFKEVRLGATEASLLHWLYPHAKFVILSRHPYDCYQSLSDAGWHHVYFRRPDVRVDSAAGFARHWNRVARSWSELPAAFPAFHLKYEDLVSGRVDFRRLESWLGLRIREKEALSTVVRHTAFRQQLSWYERLIISRYAEPGMRALGYTPSLIKARDPEPFTDDSGPVTASDGAIES